MWAILYALMGISAYQIYEAQEEKSKTALIIYFVQLTVNVLWSIVFFRFKSLSGAVAVILILLILILLMLVTFRKIRKSAFLLNLPYLAWTVFAAYLTIGIYILNR